MSRARRPSALGAPCAGPPPRSGNPAPASPGSRPARGRPPRAGRKAARRAGPPKARIVSLTIGVDVGGTKVAVGAVDEHGHIIEKLKHSTPSTSPEQITQVIGDAVTEMLGRHKADAVGIGAAGFVDALRSTVMSPPNLPWRDEPLKKGPEDRYVL